LRINEINHFVQQQNIKQSFFLSSVFIIFLLNGNNWQKILANHDSYMNKFHFHIPLFKDEALFDLDLLLDSFNVLPQNMIIDIWLLIDGKSFEISYCVRVGKSWKGFSLIIRHCASRNHKDSR
jgi:hypothetical protein